MSGTVLYKMSGSGNDFVVADGRVSSLEQWTPERIRAVCARSTGVGADGFVLLEPGTSADAVRFHFFNNDGGRVSMCGNAALCATRLAAWLEIAPARGMLLETDAGVIEARCLDGPGQRAEIVLPSTAELTRPDIPLIAGEQALHLTTVGVPHVVVVVEDVSVISLPERGRELRCHPAFAPSGANVNFVSRRAQEWMMRTYERGVEGETLACGTGAVAAAAVLAHTGQADLPLEIRTASGYTLCVSGDLTSTGQLDCPRVAGEGRLVFRATLED